MGWDGMVEDNQDKTIELNWIKYSPWINQTRPDEQPTSTSTSTSNLSGLIVWFGLFWFEGL